MLFLFQQEPGTYPSAPHVPGPGGAMVTQPGGSGMAANHNNAAYLSGLQKQQQQQMQMMSPQQKQFLQRQMMAEQVRGQRAYLVLGVKDVLSYIISESFQSSNIDYWTIMQF